MDKRLYDKVYTYYSFDEFAAHNFVVEITQEDLYGPHLGPLFAFFSDEMDND
jgi:hypothetical protein